MFTAESKGFSETQNTGWKKTCGPNAIEVEIRAENSGFTVSGRKHSDDSGNEWITWYVSRTGSDSDGEPDSYLHSERVDIVKGLPPADLIGEPLK